MLFAIAAALIPAAIAWACNPQAHVSVSSGSLGSVGPGDGITVSGSYFNSADSLTVSGPVDSATAHGPSFSVTLHAPSSPGTYTITVARSDGGYRAGLPKSTSFEVVAPSAPSAPSTGSGQSFNQPKAPHVAGVGGGGGTVHSQSGQTVFAGSVAPSSGSSGGGTFFSGTSGSSAGTAAAAPSERSAVSDVWSAFAPGKTASLTSAAAVPDGGTGSDLSLGIILLSVGLLALVGGLTTAEVMRRRKQLG